MTRSQRRRGRAGRDRVHARRPRSTRPMPVATIAASTRPARSPPRRRPRTEQDQTDHQHRVRAEIEEVGRRRVRLLVQDVLVVLPDQVAEHPGDLPGGEPVPHRRPPRPVQPQTEEDRRCGHHPDDVVTRSRAMLRRAAHSDRRSPPSRRRATRSIAVRDSRPVIGTRRPRTEPVRGLHKIGAVTSGGR